MLFGAGMFEPAPTAQHMANTDSEAYCVPQQARAPLSSSCTVDLRAPLPTRKESMLGRFARMTDSRLTASRCSCHNSVTAKDSVNVSVLRRPHSHAYRLTCKLAPDLAAAAVDGSGSLCRVGIIVHQPGLPQINLPECPRRTHSPGSVVSPRRGRSPGWTAAAPAPGPAPPPRRLRAPCRPAASPAPAPPVQQMELQILNVYVIVRRRKSHAVHAVLQRL